MPDFKESKDNPLHREYGVLSNTKYILGRIKKCRNGLIPLMLLGVVCGSVLSYFWGIFGKYVIDIIEQDLSMELKEQKLLLLIGVAGSIALLLTLGNGFSYGRIWYRMIEVRMHMITERIARVLDLPYEMLERPDVLDIAQRAQSATDGNNNGVEGMMHLMIQLAQGLFTVIVTFTAVTVLDARLILALTVLSVLSFLYFRHIIRTDKEQVWDKLAPTWRQVHYMERVTQDFDYAKDIRLFSLSGLLMRRQKAIYKGREERFDLHQKLWLRHSWVTHSLNVISRACVYAVLFVAVLKKDLTIGNFTLFLSLSSAFSAALVMLLQQCGDYKKASIETDDFRSFLELKTEGEAQAGSAVPGSEDPEITFEHVSYRYTKSEKNALTDLNLTLHPGEKLAVVGLNGAGKTTMIKLLLRLYDPTEGVIRLNGTDIRSFDRKEYYKLFAPVFQNVEIFAFPISQNISMKSPERTDADRAMKAAEEAGIGERIASLTRGLDTPLTNIVEEDGVDLSGGEKQKLALARALYKSARIVVLDEPTAALDAIAEQQLYERFDKMVGRRSAVYISHRLSSTRFCDRIAMFADGRLVEYGTHEELMALGGAYADLFNTQAQYYREEAARKADFEGVTADE